MHILNVHFMPTFAYDDSANQLKSMTSAARVVPRGADDVLPFGFEFFSQSASFYSSVLTQSHRARWLTLPTLQLQ